MTTSSLQPSYDQYIRSDAWSQRKDDYFTARGKVCAACGSYDRIDLHHMTYDRLGSERDEDMVALCETCHSQYHALYEHSSLADSQKFVAAKQASAKGKELFLKYEEFIEGRIRNARQEHAQELAVFGMIGSNPNYELLPYRTKQDRESLGRALIEVFDAIPREATREIAEREDAYVMTDSRGIGEVLFSLEYRWVAEEIKAAIWKDSYTELQKLQGVLMLDAYSLEMKKNGYWRDKSGWHKSGFMGLFGF